MRKALVAAGLVAIASWALPEEDAALLSNFVVHEHSVRTAHGPVHTLDLRAVFDPAAATEFDPRRDEVDLAIGTDLSFHVDSDRRRWHVDRRGRALWRGPRVTGQPSLRRLSIWAAQGSVRLKMDGAAGLALPIEDRAGISMRLGEAAFAGILGFVEPTGPPIPVKFERVDDYPESFACTAGTFVIGDEGAWSQLWWLHARELRAEPKVDFSTETVLAVLLGNRESRRYSAAFTKVEIRGGIVVATYTEYRPATTCGVSYYPICPYAFASIPKTTLPVVFVHDVVTGCR